MPTYSSDVLPSTTGLNLGSAAQRWNVFAQNMDISGTFNNVRYATAATAGADWGAKVQTAINALPATGGTVDATPLEGSQSAATPPTPGTKPVRLRVGNTTVTLAAPWVWAGSNCTIEGPAIGAAVFAYAGTGIALDLTGASYTSLKNIQITTSADAATALKIGSISHYCLLDGVRLIGNAAGTNTGTGLFLDGTGGYSGPLTLSNVLVNGFKFAIRVAGTNTSTATWTQIAGVNCTLTGPTGPIAGSKGIWFDQFTNGTGSQFSGSIQNFAKDVQLDAGGSFGVDIAMDMEDASPISVAYGTPTGRIRDLSFNGGFIDILSNGTTPTIAESRVGSNWIRETLAGTVTEVNTDTGSQMDWNWSRGASLINGGSPTVKFNIHTGTSGDTEPGRNYWMLLTTKFSAGIAKPTGGAHSLGDISFNTAGTVGSNIGWICTTAGTPGTWSPFGSTSNSATLNIPNFTDLVGTATNDNAAVGNIGEYVSGQRVIGSALALTTNTAANITTISLTAGDWDVGASMDFIPGATTNYTELSSGISTASATFGAQGTYFDFPVSVAGQVPVDPMAFTVPTVRLSLAGTTTVYLIGYGLFTVSTLSGAGTLWARRAR